MSVLLALRSGTRDAHDRLEEGLDVVQRCAELPSYAALLRDLHAVYAPLERALELCPATVPALPDWPARRKTAWLASDLAALVTPVGPHTAAPDVVTTEDVVGAAYVMEGATLGGAIVLRSLQPSWPARFFTSYGPRRGAMWRSFRAHVEELPGLDEQEVVAAAARTFAAFEAACLGPVR